MNYFGMLGFSFIFLGGSLFIALLVWLGHCWWIEREERREREQAMQREDGHYAGLHQALLRHVDEYAGLKASLLLHIEELLREVDRP